MSKNFSQKFLLSGHEHSLESQESNGETVFGKSEFWQAIFYGKDFEFPKTRFYHSISETLGNVPDRRTKISRNFEKKIYDRLFLVGQAVNQQIESHQAPVQVARRDQHHDRRRQHQFENLTKIQFFIHFILFQIIVSLKQKRSFKI